MAVLNDHQWCLASLDGDFEFVFGTTDTGIQTSTAPDLGQRSVRDSDTPLPREDGVGFGIDHEDGTTVTFECNVLTSGWAEQSDLLNLFRSNWSAKRFRNDHGVVAALSACAAGRTRTCYGRPRRFAEIDSDLTHEGYTGVAADFATVDGKFYADEQVADHPIRPPDVVGLISSGDTMFTSVGDTLFVTEDLTEEQLFNRSVEVGGTTDTWPVVEVHGPVTNPKVEIGDLVVELAHTIPDGMHVIFDPRPWSRGVFRSDGANLAGKLTYRTPPLKTWLLEPGSHALTYRGSDATSTSLARVRWRDAYHRP